MSIKDAPETSSVSLQKQILDIMYTMRSEYAETAEYKTIMMNLTTVSRELNAIKLKEVAGEDLKPKPVESEK